MKKILVAFMLFSFCCATVAKAEIPTTHVDKSQFVKPQEQSVMIIHAVDHTCNVVVVADYSVSYSNVVAINVGSFYTDPVISVPTPPPAVCNSPPSGTNI